ncbi:group 10 secretory phospholipase A2 [Neoarius graeffei]|uniref:group 10 secretory phospholipase A2 n=1 Tax=Neoarius graeffei TaxID=443677 RepID=UPI00298C7EEB|nr:group 10 secretory phospholipase A2 [Neoarius graeffei]
MTALYRIFLVLSVSMASLVAQRSVRSKRSLLELAGIIKCSTSRPALLYVMYGCYCGLGGKGWPRDRADWCCHKHDCCYGDAEAAGCQTTTDKYQWTCEDKEANCDCLTDRCEKILCQCDRDIGRCLRKAPYNKKYAFWPDFLCGHVHPTCNIY